MNQLQLSPLSHSSGHSSSAFGEKGSSFSAWENAKFFRAWLIYDGTLEHSRTHGRINWNLILGILVTVAISAGGWYGISMLVRYLVGIV
jgi:hypothetical protein